MKVVSTDALTKLIQLVKSAFISVDNTVETSEVEIAAYVTETYVNGKSWYRVYSDGWCEQGGESNGNYQVITLLKPFADTNYTLETLPLTDITTLASSWQIGYFCGIRVSASQIKIGTTGSWYACGYIS